MPLTTAAVMPIIVVRDMDTATRFYDEILGLELESDRGAIQVWGVGESRVMLSHSEAGSRAEHAVATWSVDDIMAVVGELRSRGVEFEDFGMSSVEGVVRMGEDQVAYFRDPDGNLLSLTQFGEH